MKKALIVFSSLVVIVGVFSSQSLAHGAKHGFGAWGGHHHSSKKANVWSAKLTPPTAAVTRTKSRHGHGYGTTGATGATPATGPAGKVLYAQSHKKYLLAAKLSNLAPATKYDVTITKTSVDPTGSTGATIAHHPHDPGATPPTGATSTPPTIGPITTDANGKGNAIAKGLRSAAGLDKRATYSVEVKDPSGTVVLAGALTRNGFRHHRGNCGGDKNPFGSDSRSKHHRR
jgi:hypothetical protein